jgi:hypothetical protein
MTVTLTGDTLTLDEVLAVARGEARIAVCEALSAR